MKNWLIVFISSVIVGGTLHAQKAKRPNIILFLVDDMGWQDTSEPFWKEKTPLNKIYRTPSMERLAKEGMKFTNAYAAPVCTPSRVSLMTGMNTGHHGVTNWTSPLLNTPTDQKDDQFETADWNYNGLSPVPGVPYTIYATTFPQLLKDAGYFTVHVGKAHWGSQGTPGANPNNMGFIVNIGGGAAGQEQSYYGEENYGNKPGIYSVRATPGLQDYYGTNTFLTEALTREALKAIETPISRNEPFYLNMAHFALHVPVQPDPRFIEHYKDLDPEEAAYATLIEGMDKSLGDIMDFLKKKGVAENTIIIFMSDNGGLSITNRGGKPNTQNQPLKAGKGSVNEGGIREPMIVKWPGVVRGGTVTNQYVIIEDFFPTILEMAGIKNYKLVQQIDGQSFVPLLKNPNQTQNTRSLIWHIPNKWIKDDAGPGINYYSAIRKGDWKLIYSLRTGKTELYNLKTDIGEEKDLASGNADRCRLLTTELFHQLKEWKAPMPVEKTTGKPLPFPVE
ncbi:sulfatase [Niabella ginsenosidivorans]|uniref:Sulfatase n=1 Tax=Niabella ginsenosidivorans TaxID=1176587 RepID=A0A1A9IBV8_9BACT|nr:sulfatase [Niabella ginsenosidivorans]ANH84054.1 sulfatase [Niabella ginsenosidivorans]